MANDRTTENRTEDTAVEPDAPAGAELPQAVEDVAALIDGLPVRAPKAGYDQETGAFTF